jgi:hypothetical protein
MCGNCFNQQISTDKKARPLKTEGESNGCFLDNRQGKNYEAYQN